MIRNEYSSTIENITESVYAAGFVKSKNQYEVYATVSGVIKETYVAEGQLVKKGRPLLKLHNETSNPSLRNAELAAWTEPIIQTLYEFICWRMVAGNRYFHDRTVSKIYSLFCKNINTVIHSSVRSEFPG